MTTKTIAFWWIEDRILKISVFRGYNIETRKLVESQLQTDLQPGSSYLDMSNTIVPFSGHGALIPKLAKICIENDGTKIFCENFHIENTDAFLSKCS